MKVDRLEFSTYKEVYTAQAVISLSMRREGKCKKYAEIIEDKGKYKLPKPDDKHMAKVKGAKVVKDNVSSF